MMKLPWTGPERRQTLRLEVPLTVRFRITNTEGKGTASRVLHGETGNVSREGLCIETNTVEADGLHVFGDTLMIRSSEIAMEIDLPGEGDPLRCVGKVVWYDRSKEGAPFRFRVGVQLTRIDEEEKKRLKALLSELKRKTA